MPDTGAPKGDLVPTADVSARLAWPDDAAAIADLAISAWSTSDAASPDTLQQLEPDALAERWAHVITAPRDARMRTLVALERADVRGFVLVHPSYDPDSDQVADGEIGEFIVSPEHRRAGHGSRLLQAAVDTLRADAFTRATWWVAASDDATRAFASSAGWAADGAHRELADDSGRTIKQVRLHTSLA